MMVFIKNTKSFPACLDKYVIIFLLLFVVTVAVVPFKGLLQIYISLNY